MTNLDAPQGRVVGSLIEKQLTTPQQYPLTLNALLAACNQASNREPVTDYTEDQLVLTLDQLKDQRLVRFVLPSHGRSVVRYRQVLDEALGLDPSQLAVLAVLLLRGPQTVGELRTRTERMAQFDGLAQVEHELDLLAAADPPLVVCLSRRPGQKEERWADLLREPSEPPPAPTPVPTSTSGAGATSGPPDAVASRPEIGDGGDGGGVPALRADLDRLVAEVAALRAELGSLRAELGSLRDSLGG
ncbi:MAG TPA: DUF480 domain-containing protein [Acidimicrobiales bacterium]|nr:DUF480 domain-containing protein [Acidimicrobiales bacterium]